MAAPGRAGTLRGGPALSAATAPSTRHRLVARSLETEWNTALQALADTEAELARRAAARPKTLTPQEKTTILALGHDLAGVSMAPTTTDQDRKRLLRSLLDEVVLSWKGGAITDLRVPIRRKRQPSLLRTAQLLALTRAFDTALRRRAFPPTPAVCYGQPGGYHRTHTGWQRRASNRVRSRHHATPTELQGILPSSWQMTFELFAQPPSVGNSGPSPHSRQRGRTLTPDPATRLRHSRGDQLTDLIEIAGSAFALRDAFDRLMRRRITRRLTDTY